MLKQNLKLAWRRLIGNPLFSGITVIGLGLGLAAFLLILQYVAFERGFNRSFSKAENIFRIVVSHPEQEYVTFLPPALGPAIRSNISGVETTIRIAQHSGDGVFTVSRPSRVDQETVFRESNTALVEGNFLAYFDRPILDGAPDLSAPYTLALSAQTAMRYFGTENAVGRELQVNNQFGEARYTVSAVFEDFPPQSDIRPDILLSLRTLASAEGRGGADWADLTSWDNAFLQTILVLDNPATAETVAGSIEQLVRKSFGEDTPVFYLQAITDMHLGNGLRDPLPTYSSALTMWFLVMVALLILLIAWINYVNLSTAKALQRLGEFSVRKVVGATRIQLIRQHLWETAGYAFLALALGFLLLEICQGAFGQVMGLDMDDLGKGSYRAWWAGLLVFPVLVLAAGFYVAQVMTRFRSELALRGNFAGTPTGGRLRQVLVVGQFAVSIALMAGTFLLYKQLQFLQHRDLGASLEKRLAIAGPEVRGESTPTAFLNRLDQLPWVEGRSASGGIPGKGYNFSANRITRENPDPGDENKGYNMIMIDNQYLETYSIQLHAGQGFAAADLDKGWGSGEVLINERAAHELGFEPAGNAVNAFIYWGENRLRVKGLVRDYNHQSLHAPVEPTLFFPGINTRYFTLVMKPEDLQTRLAQLQEAFTEVYPGNPFQYFFVEDSFNRAYRAEQRAGWIFAAATLLALFISSMGLFGLAVYTAEQKTKEIGIRKVLGASVAQLVSYLAGDFLKLVCLAILIALPLAWYGAHRWLEHFAYRTELSWWIFAGSALAGLVIAVLTVSAQTWRVARANPVHALRNE